MLDIFIIVTLLCGLACVLAFTGFVLQLVIDRFIDETLPRLSKLYFAIRYPREFERKYGQDTRDSD